MREFKPDPKAVFEDDTDHPQAGLQRAGEVAGDLRLAHAAAIVDGNLDHFQPPLQREDDHLG
jgi:hypothetical protein